MDEPTAGTEADGFSAMATMLKPTAHRGDDLADDMATIQRQFRALCRELHIPFLDIKLYEKYVMSDATPQNLYRLTLVTKLITLYDFPLCSHLPSRALFEHHVALLRGTTAPAPSATKAAVKFQTRLQTAEALLKRELESQQGLVQELRELGERGLFLPILATPLVPGCNTGIAVRSAAWRGRLQQAVQQSLLSLSIPVGPVPTYAGEGEASGPEADPAGAEWEEDAGVPEEEHSLEEASGAEAEAEAEVEEAAEVEGGLAGSAEPVPEVDVADEVEETVDHSAGAGDAKHAEVEDEPMYDQEWDIGDG